LKFLTTNAGRSNLSLTPSCSDPTFTPNEHLERVCELRSGTGNHDGAIAAARCLVRLEPLSEEAHRTLMQAFAAAHRRAEAIGHYHLLAVLLKRELQVEPDDGTRALIEGIAGGKVPVHARQPVTPAPQRQLVSDSADDISLAAQIVAVEHELALRRQVYPRRIAEGRLDGHGAERRIKGWPPC
jgi:hypothetical protein